MLIRGHGLPQNKATAGAGALIYVQVMVKVRHIAGEKQRYLAAQAAMEITTMKVLLIALSLMMVSSTVLAHGGGCRKSSPPGQCCHMDNSKGSVHCH